MQKRIIAIVVVSVCTIAAMIVLSLLPSINLSNNEEPSPGLEWGFTMQTSHSMPSNYCAYRSDKSEFDIDDVTITFYFGRTMSYSVDWIREELYSIPEFDVYFGETDDWTTNYYEPIYIIRHSTENYVSEEYRCKRVSVTEPQGCRGSREISMIEYNHSEEVTIPKELFNKEHGVLNFCVAGIVHNPRGGDDIYDLLNIAFLCYDIVNDKVVLSQWDGRAE